MLHVNTTLLSGGRSILIVWELQYTGGSSVTSFNITLTSSNVTIIREIDVGIGQLVIDGLEPNTSYMLMTQLANELGATVESLSIVTSRGGPDKPTKPVTDQISSNSVQLMFNISSIGSEPLTAYLVNVSNEQGIVLFNQKIPVTVQPRPGDVISLNVYELTGGKFYTFSVAADTDIGRSPFSEYSDIIRTG